MTSPTPDPEPLHVLLVDDDPHIRDLLSSALKGSGFRISAASTGEEAVAIYRQDGTIQVVLLDVQMPGLTGPETLAALRQHDPRVHALFMSGGTGEYNLLELEALAGGELLVKPFRSLPAVVDALRRAAQT